MKDIKKSTKISAMIVDDYSKMRFILKKMLESVFNKQQIRIYECCDGKEAIDTFTKHQPDWILMDLKMETMDGLAATKAILKIRNDANIIILTQFDDIEYYEAAKKLGVKAFVLKEDILDIPALIKNLI